MTDLICILTGSHCQGVLKGGCKVQRQKGNSLEAITLTQGSDDGGLDEGCSSESGKKSSVFWIYFKLEQNLLTIG